MLYQCKTVWIIFLKDSYNKLDIRWMCKNYFLPPLYFFELSNILPSGREKLSKGTTELSFSVHWFLARSISWWRCNCLLWWLGINCNELKGAKLINLSSSTWFLYEFESLRYLISQKRKVYFVQAASPDEAALVVASKVLGAFFFRRTLSTVLVKELTEDGQREVEYELLAVLEFNSTRKRQSVIIRHPDGSIRLYCKVDFLLKTISS